MPKDTYNWTNSNLTAKYYFDVLGAKMVYSVYLLPSPFLSPKGSLMFLNCSLIVF